MLKDYTFHVLHILFESAMMQKDTDLKLTDTGHMEYEVTYC